MNSYLNYIIEANLGLCLFLFAYFLLFRYDTDFKVKRMILLGGIICSLIFPMISFQPASMPALGEMIPLVWLPEFTYDGNPSPAPIASDGVFWWQYSAMAYGAGVVIFLILFIIQIARMLVFINRIRPVRHGSLLIAESDENMPCFSFFNFVHIGQATTLSEKDKEQIIQHEQVHVNQMHSLDILLLNVLTIFFWFNPVLRLYKKIFVQLHEFEADARAVKNNDLNDYCSLLARAALLSADLRLANHFSNSLTLKRIEMIRKIKSKIHGWKFVVVASIVPVFFVIVACNDQVMKEVADIAESSHMALAVPQHVQQRYDILKAENPDKKYILLEMSRASSEKLGALEKEYGLPVSFELFKSGDEETSMKASGGITIIASEGATIHKEQSSTSDQSKESYVILEYNKKSSDFAEFLQQDGVFTIVDETASFPGGMGEFYKFLGKTLQYPRDAKESGVEGKVFIEFVVEPDGSLSAITIIKGLHESMDAEVLRAMALSPKWTPAVHKGEKVRQKMVLPVSFSIGKDNALFKKTSTVMDLFYPIPPLKPVKDNC